MLSIATNAMHFYSLKHSITTILASRVDNIFHVKTHLGRAAISSTMQYGHPNQKATAAKVKEILGQAFAKWTNCSRRCESPTRVFAPPRGIVEYL